MPRRTIDRPGVNVIDHIVRRDRARRPKTYLNAILGGNPSSADTDDRVPRNCDHGPSAGPWAAGGNAVLIVVAHGII